jgi:hypothetical protein
MTVAHENIVLKYVLSRFPVNKMFEIHFTGYTICNTRFTSTIRKNSPEPLENATTSIKWYRRIDFCGQRHTCRPGT